MDDFPGKVAPIMGAGPSIGRVLALALTQEGVRVVLADIDESGLAEAAQAMRASGRVWSTAKETSPTGPQSLAGLTAAAPRTAR